MSIQPICISWAYDEGICCRPVGVSRTDHKTLFVHLCTATVAMWCSGHAPPGSRTKFGTVAEANAFWETTPLGGVRWMVLILDDFAQFWHYERKACRRLFFSGFDHEAWEKEVYLCLSEGQMFANIVLEWDWPAQWCTVSISKELGIGRVTYYSQLRIGNLAESNGVSVCFRILL